MNKVITCVLLLLVSISTFSQTRFYVGGDFNVSTISDSKFNIRTDLVSDNPNYTYFKSEGYIATYNQQLGLDFYAGLNQAFFSDFSFDIQLGVNNSNFTQTLVSKTKYFLQDKTNGELTEVENLHSTNSSIDKHYQVYLTMPFGISYYLLEETLAIGMGFTPSFLITSLGAKSQSTEFNKLAMGMHLNLRYNITNHTWVTLEYQENSTKLYKPELKQSLSSLRHIKLGLRYYL